MLVQLRTFYVVARAGSMTRAADLVRYSQPTVSQHVRSLERHVGEQLLERDRAHLPLTARGLEVARLCEQILPLVEGLLAQDDTLGVTRQLPPLPATPGHRAHQPSLPLPRGQRRRYDHRP